MSSAFVPGLILLLAAPESCAEVLREALSSNSCTPGDLGPSWSSAMGGGEGSLGEEEGDTVEVMSQLSVTASGLSDLFVLYRIAIVDLILCQWIKLLYFLMGKCLDGISVRGCCCAGQVEFKA